MSEPFVPPNPDTLKAMAGWSITKQSGASDAQALALGQFRDGCENLAENYPATATCPVVVTSKPQNAPAHRIEESSEPMVLIPRTMRTGPQRITEDVLAVIAPDVLKQQQTTGTCPHKFHIKTQICIYCGLSYRQVKGHSAELMAGG